MRPPLPHSPPNQKNLMKAKPLYKDSPSKLILGGLTSLLLLNAFASCAVLARGDGSSDYAFIQTTGGETIQAIPVHHSRRTEEAVQKFATDWIVLMLSWKGRDDPGLVAFRQKVPTNFYKLSWALNPNIRSAVAQAWMNSFNAERYVNTSKYSTVFALSGNPITSEKDGVWTVDIYGSRILLENGSQVALDRYNLRLTIEAVIPQPNPLGKDSTALEQLISKAQASGLSIINVEEI